MNRVLAFAAVMASVHFVVPYAMPSFDPTLVQSAAITVLAMVGREVLTPEMPAVYLLNGKQNEEEID